MRADIGVPCKGQIRHADELLALFNKYSVPRLVSHSNLRYLYLVGCSMLESNKQYERKDKWIRDEAAHWFDLGISGIAITDGKCGALQRLL